MKIYIDVIMFIDFMINFIFLWLINYVLNEKIVMKRILLASFLSALLVVGYLFNYIIYNIFKLWGGFIIILIATNKNIVIKVAAYYLLQFALIGITNSYNIHDFKIIFAILIILVLVLIQSQKKIIITKNNFLYDVKIVLGSKTYLLKGFLDTGNTTLNVCIPVIYLDYKYYNSKLKSLGIIYVKTIAGIIERECYVVDEFIIKINKKEITKEVCVAFTELSDHECILNGCILEGGKL